jgi:hypothetical protein
VATVVIALAYAKYYGYLNNLCELCSPKVSKVLTPTESGSKTENSTSETKDTSNIVDNKSADISSNNKQLPTAENQKQPEVTIISEKISASTVVAPSTEEEYTCGSATDTKEQYTEQY